MDIEEQYDKIYRFCYYRVKNKETAEDLTQEIFLRFLKSPYEERGERIRYLYTIARNLCTEEMRRERAGGQAMLIMCASSILIVTAFAAITMFLSEFTHNGNVPIWSLMTALLMTVFIHYGIFYRNRTLAQLWQYLPMQRINDSLLYDERLVRIGSLNVMSIPLGMWIYLGLTVVFSVLCFCHAIFSKDNI